MARSKPSRNTPARRLAAGAALLLLVLGGAPAHAQDKIGAAEPPARAETKHTITLAGRPLDYRAIAETIGLTDTEGAPTASIYTVSYLDEAPARQRRPVAFVFNGGPGAASACRHLSALGPRILDPPPSGRVP